MAAFLAFFSVLSAAQPIYLEELASDRLQTLDFSQKPTLLTFIQTGCFPCKKQLNELKCVHEKYSDRVQIVAVQTAGDSAELRRSLKSLHLSFPVLKGSPSFLNRYEADKNGTPMTVLLAKGGAVEERVLGPKPCPFWAERIAGEKR